MKIKVLHVIDHLGYGGAPFVVKSIAERVSKEKVESLVCALRPNPEPIPLEAEVINLNFHKYNPLAFLRISNLCRNRNIDIVHAHLQKSVISCLLASFRCGSKIVIHEHGPIFRSGGGYIYRLLLKALASRASAAIGNSQATKEALMRVTSMPEESVSVISNFIDFSRFDPAGCDRDKVRANIGIGADKVVIGFVGRLDFCKGADLLVKAASILCKSDQKYFFVIVGYGPEKDRLEELARDLGLQDKVLFTGLCKNAAEIIGAFDIAVVPSRREAFGISAVEFMRMNVPVVAASVGGLTELIRHEQTGMLAEGLRGEGIAEAVDALARDKSLRERLKANAAAFARRFDGEEQIGKIEELYEKLCS